MPGTLTPPTSFRKRLRFLGPSLILTGSIVGSGELIITTTLGARMGFVALWLIILSCALKVIIQEEIGRYTISSGDTSLEGANRMPGPRWIVSWVVWAWMIMTALVCIQVGGIVPGNRPGAGHALPRSRCDGLGTPDIFSYRGSSSERPLRIPGENRHSAGCLLHLYDDCFRCDDPMVAPRHPVGRGSGGAQVSPPRGRSGRGLCRLWDYGHRDYGDLLLSEPLQGKGLCALCRPEPSRCELGEAQPGMDFGYADRRDCGYVHLYHGHHRFLSPGSRRAAPDGTGPGRP